MAIERHVLPTLLISFFAAMLAAAPAIAQEWPTRSITIVVPYAAGGPNDTVARVVSARLGEILRAQIVIENVGGAGGMTGSNRVAKAAPDGYTLLLASSAGLAQIPNLYKRPLYNAVTDFEAVTLLTDSARILITRKDFPAKTLAEFIAYTKVNAAKLQYSSAGAGSGGHTCAILLDTVMGTHVAHVPYRGAGPALTDLMAGRIVRAGDDGVSADRGGRHQGDRNAWANSAERAQGPADRRGAGRGGPRLQCLDRLRGPQGNAGRDRSPPRRRFERGA